MRMQTEKSHVKIYNNNHKARRRRRRQRNKSLAENCLFHQREWTLEKMYIIPEKSVSRRNTDAILEERKKVQYINNDARRYNQKAHTKITLEINCMGRVCTISQLETNDPWTGSRYSFCCCCSVFAGFFFLLSSRFTFRILFHRRIDEWSVKRTL